MRVSLFAKSKAYRPLLQRKSPLMPDLSRLSPRTISEPSEVERTPSVVLQPSPQWVQMVPTGFISQGRGLFPQEPLVIAPTGEGPRATPPRSQRTRGGGWGGDAGGVCGWVVQGMRS